MANPAIAAALSHVELPSVATHPQPPTTSDYSIDTDESRRNLPSRSHLSQRSTTLMRPELEKEVQQALGAMPKAGDWGWEAR